MSLIEEARRLAKESDNVYLLDLIEGFLSEKDDLKYKSNLYKAINEVVEFIRPMHAK
ncbi:MAG: hypothetical protein ACE5KT_05560 [Methanosarcinales archaeon]